MKARDMVLAILRTAAPRGGRRVRDARPGDPLGPDGSGAPRGRRGALGVFATLLLTLCALIVGPTLASALAPTVTIEPATPHFDGAVVEGTVNPEGQSTSYHFDYISEAAYSAHRDAEQKLIVSATQGIYTLSFAGQTTIALSFQAGAAEVESALDSLSSIGGVGGSVTVTGGPGDQPGSTPYLITFGGALSETNVETLGIEATGLSGGSGGSVETTVAGRQAGFEGAEATAEETTETSGPVSATIAGLSPGTTYHLRLVAQNGDGPAEAVGPTFTTTVVAAPTVEEVTAVLTGASTASVAGKVNSGGPNPGEATRWHFECTPGCTILGGSGEVTDGADHQVSAELTGLQPHTSYTVSLVAENAQTRAQGSPVSASAAPIETGQVPPTIFTTTPTEPTPTSIQLNAMVNPHNSVLSDCHFLYGSGGALDHSVPCSSIPPSANEAAVVSAPVAGLTPGTTYEFELLAANLAGTTVGEAESFTTPTGSRPEICPNQATREKQHSTSLPDCRAYEMVSPLAKGNEDIVGDGITTVSSRSGDAVAFNGRSQFAGSVGSGVSGESQYVARRGPEGWGTRAITPMPRPDALQTFFAATKVQVYSTDLSSAILWGYDLPEAVGDEPNRNSMYLEDTATRALRPITVSQAEPLGPFDNIGEQIWGISDDARHVAFATGTRLLPGPGLPPGVSKLYQWDEGRLSVAGVLPDGEIPPGGANVFPKNFRGAMSADGSELAFNASPSGGSPSEFDSQLYLRINGSRTIWVSEPEGSNASTPTEVVYQGMTPDGRYIFFCTASALLDEDTNGGPDLYRYSIEPDPTTGRHLTMISQDGKAPGAANGGALIGTSDDAERVYYQTTADTIEVWNHGSVSLVTPGVSRKGEDNFQLTLSASEPGWGRVTPDGDYMAYVYGGTLFLYSLADDTLKEVSSEAEVTPSVTRGNPVITNVGFRPQFLDSRGRVYFSTTQALRPEDVNGVADAYEYDPTTGELTLLSTGRGSTPSMFADASASGDDVFFVTRQPLSAADSDELVDLYDAHVGGSPYELRADLTPPCSGEGCQGVPAAAPGATSSASSALRGAGNVKPAKHRCANNSRQVKRKAKVRCVKKHQKTKKHRAQRRLARGQGPRSTSPRQHPEQADADRRDVR